MHAPPVELGGKKSDTAKEGPTTRRGAKKAAGRAAASAEGSQQAEDAAMQQRHASAMHAHAFFQAPLEQSHAFRKDATAGSHENASYAQRNKAIMKQVRSYSLNMNQQCLRADEETSMSAQISCLFLHSSRRVLLY
jgi:hypothetical protein